MIGPDGQEYDPNNPGMACESVNDRVALAFFIGSIFAASFILSRSTSNYQYLWWVGGGQPNIIILFYKSLFVNEFPWLQGPYVSRGQEM